MCQVVEEKAAGFVFVRVGRYGTDDQRRAERVAVRESGGEVFKNRISGMNWACWPAAKFSRRLVAAGAELGRRVKSVDPGLWRFLPYERLCHTCGFAFIEDLPWNGQCLPCEQAQCRDAGVDEAGKAVAS